MSRSSDAAHRTRHLWRARAIPGDDPREDQCARPITARSTVLFCPLGLKRKLKILAADALEVGPTHSESRSAGNRNRQSALAGRSPEQSASEPVRVSSRAESAKRGPGELASFMVL